MSEIQNAKTKAEIELMNAEIAKMIQDSIRETRQAGIEHQKILAEIDRTRAERAKIDRERAWYPAVAMATAAGATAALIGATAAVVKFFFT